jgi:diguanylate cyclase (GGDEF)-like protein
MSMDATTLAESALRFGGQELALRSETLRAVAALDLLGAGIVGIDPEGRIEYIDRVASELTGWTLQSARTRPAGDVLVLRDPATNCDGSDEPGLKGALRILVGRSSREVPVFVSSTRLRGDLEGRRVVVLRDATAECALRWQLSFDAQHDSLTELLNRASFEAELATAVASAKAGTHHALLYLELDQFKLVNDTCGHPAGDALLRRLATILTDGVRRSDVLARIGGDEFAVLLRRCSIENAIETAEALRERIAAYRFSWYGQSLRITASIGVVEITAESESVSTVLSAADVACFAAKELGRNRVHVCRGSAPPARCEEMRLVLRLARACEEGRFQVYFQPIVPVSANPNEPAHYELLLRMIDESGEVVSPGVFVPAAERYGLMPDVDRWIVRHTLAQLAQLDDVRAPCMLAVNISGTSLSDDRFLDFVREELKISPPPPGSVCFEITETAAIANPAAVERFMRELRKLGCRFSLDDFGSGLSSFAYLKDLPVDFLKIDGRFIRNICADTVDDAMVEAIVRIGRAMGIKTVAEHVESEAAAERLAVLGVDYAQGYYYARPALVQRGDLLALAATPRHTALARTA